MSKDIIIQAETLVKNYRLGDAFIVALDHVSLTIESGEMVAITGASGSGKSTLMNILGCLDRLDSGKYILAGSDVSKLSSDRLARIRNRYIGFVFQTFNLLPRMSSLENVELPLLYGRSQKTRERAIKALDAVGLSSRLHHEPNQLSGGQRQRVAVARALVTDPALILADEPTGNLDTKTGTEIMELFKQLHRDGRTIVVVTHNPDIANYCQRKFHLRDGKMVDNN